MIELRDITESLNRSENSSNNERILIDFIANNMMTELQIPIKTIKL